MIHKATANFEEATKLFEHYTNLDERFLKLRNIVLAKKQPRGVFVQSNTKLEGNTVTLTSYEATPQGIIQSFLDRYTE